jgi:hypothetical protein
VKFDFRIEAWELWSLSKIRAQILFLPLLMFYFIMCVVHHIPWSQIILFWNLLAEMGSKIPYPRESYQHSLAFQKTLQTQAIRNMWSLKKEVFLICMRYTVLKWHLLASSSPHTAFRYTNESQNLLSIVAFPMLRETQYFHYISVHIHRTKINFRKIIIS